MEVHHEQRDPAVEKNMKSRGFGSCWGTHFCCSENSSLTEELLTGEVGSVKPFIRDNVV